VRARAKVLPRPPPLPGQFIHPSVSIALTARLPSRRKPMQGATSRFKASWRNRVTLRHGWQRLAHPASLQRSVRLVRTGIAIGGSRQTWIAIGAAVGHASSVEWSRARSTVGYRRRGRHKLATTGSAAENSAGVQTTLKVRERNTLEIGACIVLTSLGVGVQFGRWPEWTALVAVGGYVTWVALYAETTVQVKRRRIGRIDPATPDRTSARPAPQPAQEHSPA
jgi:hypothetical protein